jgi:hypothetical protein
MLRAKRDILSGIGIGKGNRARFVSNSVAKEGGNCNVEAGGQAKK